MELLELKNKTLELFQIENVSELGEKLYDCVQKNDIEKMDRFCELVQNDLSKDWLQMIYQYYQADRKDKKQDYTPKCLCKFLSKLIGESDETIDMCAGSGALTIQRWSEYKDMNFVLYEIDENVIPYLIFNMVIRNVNAIVKQHDVLQNETIKEWKIVKGEYYGKISNIKSAI